MNKNTMNKNTMNKNTMNKNTMNKNVEELDELLASKFEGSIVSALMRDDYEYKAIRSRVLDICLSTRLILDQSKEVRNKNYAWVIEVIDLNVVALELLDNATTTPAEPMSLSDIKQNVNLKAEAIIKDIVKRLLNTQLPFPVSVEEQGSTVVMPKSYGYK